MIQEVIDKIFDPGTFVQTYAYLISNVPGIEAYNGDGAVTGYGSSDDRLVYIAASDSNFMNGAMGISQANKIVKTIELAQQMGAPFVFVIDTAGARLQEGLCSLSGYANIIAALNKASGVIPLIAIVNGACPGAAAIMASSCDFIFMNKEKGFLSVNGPETVKADSNETVTLQNIAGAEFNGSVSGNAVCISDSADESFEQFKRLLTFLPDNCTTGAEDLECIDDLNRTSLVCKEYAGKDTYDVTEIVKDIADEGDIFCLYNGYAQNALVCFARFNGRVTGVIANNTAYKNGLLDSAACAKISEFLSFCNNYMIPVVTLTSAKGFFASKEEEANGISQVAAMMMSSFVNSDIPKINIIIGDSYGAAYSAMNSKEIGADYVCAWNNANIAALSPEANVVILYKDEIGASSDPVEKRKELTEQYIKDYANPYNAASYGYIDEIIDPAETRARIISALEMSSSKSFN